MPTALELTREGWMAYLEGFRRRHTQPELTPAEQKEWQRLLDRVREVAAALKTRFGVRRVVLFGSLVHPDRFRSGSDVDLAVEGLRSGEDYWQAWRAIEDTIDDRSIDLIDIETAGESLKRAIQQYGIEL